MWCEDCMLSRASFPVLHTHIWNQLHVLFQIKWRKSVNIAPLLYNITTATIWSWLFLAWDWSGTLGHWADMASDDDVMTELRTDAGNTSTTLPMFSSMETMLFEWVHESDLCFNDKQVCNLRQKRNIVTIKTSTDIPCHGVQDIRRELHDAGRPDWACNDKQERRGGRQRSHCHLVPKHSHAQFAHRPNQPLSPMRCRRRSNNILMTSAYAMRLNCKSAIWPSLWSNKECPRSKSCIL